MAYEPPADRERLLDLINDIDQRLPPCNDEAFQMVAYIKADDLLQPVRDGRLVVISRGMLRRIRDALKQA